MRTHSIGVNSSWLRTRAGVGKQPSHAFGVWVGVRIDADACAARRGPGRLSVRPGPPTSPPLVGTVPNMPRKERTLCLLGICPSMPVVYQKVVNSPVNGRYRVAGGGAWSLRMLCARGSDPQHFRCVTPCLSELLAIRWLALIEIELRRKKICISQSRYIRKKH